MSEGLCWWLIVLVIWLIINGLDAIWIYFYIRACVDPNPRNAVNRSHSGFEGYEAMMFFFGFVWGLANLGVAWLYYAWLFSSNRFRGALYIALKAFINLFIVFPIFVVLVITPFFGGWIILPLAQQWAWEHRCDSFPMYAILDGKGYYDPGYISSVTHFYQQGNPNSMFTFDISNPDGSGDYRTFALREWDQSPLSSIPLQFYPTLQQINYDFIQDSFSGNCTIPVPGSSNLNTSAIPCTNGTFNPGNFLSFDIGSSVPLNTTDNASSLPFNDTQLRTVDEQWAFSDDAPSLILETSNPSNGKLQGYIVLRTAVTKKGDCTQLKVCLSGANGQVAGPVGAETLVPLGLVMLRQADYAYECTAPSDSGN